MPWPSTTETNWLPVQVFMRRGVWLSTVGILLWLLFGFSDHADHRHYTLPTMIPEVSHAVSSFAENGMLRRQGLPPSPNIAFARMNEAHVAHSMQPLGAALDAHTPLSGMMVSFVAVWALSTAVVWAGARYFRQSKPDTGGSMRAANHQLKHSGWMEGSYATSSASHQRISASVSSRRSRMQTVLRSQAIDDILPALQTLPSSVQALLAIITAASVGGIVYEGANAEPAVGTLGATAPDQGRSYVVGLVPFFLLVPFFSRPTFRYEIVAGKIWGFEQKQGIGLGLNTAVNVRMTVVRLKDGGLWIHGPIAATAECIALVKELERTYGPVRYIVLPTTLLEHKLWVGPFARKFPKSKTYVVKGQYSFPINAPLPVFSGIFPEGLITEDNQKDMPWADEFDHTLFDPPSITPLGKFITFTEAAFFHRETRTLLVTDMVIHVTDTVPAVITKRDCLESGDDKNFALTCLQLLNFFGTREAAEARAKRLAGRRISEAEQIQLGWQRNALTALYFGYRNAFDPEESWRGITNRLVVPPVLGVFVYENASQAARQYAESVCQWNFQRVIPAHFDVGDFSPLELQAAFDCFYSPAEQRLRQLDPRRLLLKQSTGGVAWPAADVQLLRDVEQFLTDKGVIYPNS